MLGPGSVDITRRLSVAFTIWLGVLMKVFFASLLLLLGAANCSAQEEKPIEESSDGAKSLGYSTVSEALTSLKNKPGTSITVTKPDGWTIVNETSPEFAVWSFAPQGHYAYPAVVRRTIKNANGQVYVVTAALCQADKLSCDKLIREFQQLTDKMKSQYQPQPHTP